MITTALVSRISRRRPTSGSRRGLTLLEVLLAVGVAALIAAGGDAAKAAWVHYEAVSRRA